MPPITGAAAPGPGRLEVPERAGNQNGRDRMSEVDVVVIGAGSAGIGAGRRLAELRPDLSIIVLEASERAGGRALTVEPVPGLPLDLGCGWLHGAKDNAWAHVAEASGFAISHALSSWDGGGRDLGLSRDDDKAASAALEQFFERAEVRGADEPDVPLSSLLEPENPWNGLIGAVGTFINGVELERASLRDFYRYEPGQGPDTRVVAGYGCLLADAASHLDIRYGTTVRSVDSTGPRLQVETDTGSVLARAVVVTVATNVLAREQIRFMPALPAKVAAATRLPLGLANKLFLSLPDPDAFQPETYCKGPADRVRSGSYHLRPFGRPVIECYYGGALARDLEAAGEAASLAFAREELARHVGSDLVRRMEVLACSAWQGTPFIGGSYSYAEVGAWTERAVLAAPVDNRLFFAGEACSPHRYSTAHGAFETGIGTAEQITNALGR